MDKRYWADGQNKRKVEKREVDLTRRHYGKICQEGIEIGEERMGWIHLRLHFGR